jgi:hypothetical protein
MGKKRSAATQLPGEFGLQGGPRRDHDCNNLCAGMEGARGYVCSTIKSAGYKSAHAIGHHQEGQPHYDSLFQQDAEHQG